MLNYLKALALVFVQAFIAFGILYFVQGRPPSSGDMGMALAIGALIEIHRRK